MSLIEKIKENDNETINVEGILANFFLEKLEMQDSKSEDDSGERRRKKHKKHKSKKSKTKHKKSRSRSSERKIKDSLKFIGDHSSSEEKDIQKLQKLKKMDAKDNRYNSSCLPVSVISGIQNSDNSNSNINIGSSSQCDIPYGPSLETLLSGAVNSMTKDKTSIEINNFNTETVVKTEVYNNKNKKNCSGLDENNSDIKVIISDGSNSVKNSLSGNSMSDTSKDMCKSVLKECPVDNVKRNVIASQSKLRSNNSRSRSDSRSEDEGKSSKVRLSRSEKWRSRSSSNSHSRSRSRSEDEGKNSKARLIRSEKRRSRSRSRSKHKSHKKRRSHSRNRSYSSSNSDSRKSRSRSREYRKSYKERSGRKRSRSLSRRRHRSHSRSRSSERYVSRSGYKRHRSRSRSYDRSRYSPFESSRYTSKSYRKRDSSSEYESKSRKSRKYSRSKSREKERNTSDSPKIDQAKIRQLAQKNVLNMIEKGTLPEGLSLENFKKEQLVSLKAGGKSVQELTDFCTKLSKRENEPQEQENDLGKDSADGNSGFIHHPFKIKEASTIKLNIKNAVQIPVRTHAEKVAETARLSSQFPVSSGNQHRQKELEWIPVEPSTKVTKGSNDTKAVVPLIQPATTVPASPKPKIDETVPSVVDSLPSVMPSAIPLPATESSVLALQPPPLPPIPPPLPPPIPPSSLLSSFTAPTQPSNVPSAIEYPVNSTNSYSIAPTFSFPVSTAETSSFLPQTSSNVYMTHSPSVYPVSTTMKFRSKKPIDVATIVTQRFKALTKLQSNPNDPEALHTLEQAQACIQDWVQSQQVPGLFTGSTGAKPLSVEELSGPRHWQYRAKKDIFMRAAPVTEGRGMSLLKKMGWNPGEGLGKNKEGSLEPLVLDIKTDKKGLVSEGEGSKKMVSSVLKDLQGKHPVSALMELCSKRKWKPPLYTLVKESGPPHKRLFLFKVEVNNVEYQSASPVNNKKVAKADAAVICLQALSVFPKT